ncbi:MAG: sulfur carrier protein ThiS [Bdellovibrionales bacterium]|nr:sulfur carrier protein ThiS [Bdellovibrionales bacterium]
MGIRFNGEPRETVSSSVQEFLRELQLEGRPIAVELNRAIVPRAAYQETVLKDGDAIEIVQFVGGG